MWGSCFDKTTDASGVATIKCIPVLITLLINAVFILAGTTALIFIIVGGYKYTMSRGDPKEADGARKTLQFAIVGLIIVLFSAEKSTIIRPTMANCNVFLAPSASLGSPRDIVYL